MKKKYIIFTISLFLLLPIIVKADCTEAEINHFKEIEDNYTIEKEYDYDTKTYTLTFNNPEPNNYGYVLKYVVNRNEIIDKSYEYHVETYNYSDLTPNTYNVEIIGLTNTCNDTLKTLTLNLTKQNPYASDPLCDDAKEFVLCQEDYGKDIDYDTFVSRVNTYKNTKEQNQSKEEIEKVINYVKDNVINIIILIVLTIVIIISIITIIRTSRKRRRLE